MENLTPMMKQYFNIKKDYEDTLLFYRLGDFYELFFDDARIVSKECDLVLTSRSKEIDKTPMCGVPYHSVTPYIQKLLNRGYKIAIVEQMEPPSATKKLVKREVVRVVTPGTMVDELSDVKETVYIGALEDAHYGMALALVEVASGKSNLLWINHPSRTLIPTLLKHNVKELLIPSDLAKKINDKMLGLEAITLTIHDDYQLQTKHHHLFDEDLNDTYKVAIGRLLSYLVKTQFNELDYLQAFSHYNHKVLCELDYTTINNLDLIQPSKYNRNQITLFSYLDDCKSAMGSRLLKQWIVEPLFDKEAILERQNKVTYLMKSYLLLDQIQKQLSEVYDLERIVTKIAYKRAHPQDLVQLKTSLASGQIIIDLLKEHEPFNYLNEVNTLDDVLKDLNKALIVPAPTSTKEGNIFLDTYHPDVERFRSIMGDGSHWLLQFEQAEREKTQIKNLKIGYNRVFGYYIEVSKGNIHLVKEEYGYIRKQTLVNAERFISAELKEKEDELLHAKDKLYALEENLFIEYLDSLQSHIAPLQKLADHLAMIDVLAAFAQVSLKQRLVAPQFNGDNKVEIKGSIHPLLEKVKAKHEVVANDWNASNDQHVFILTGPNMGGKSTYMRQLALLVIMAQMGTYVPAKSAKLPLFDAIFTRIGASDDILSGQSTFMVEMLEANTALSQASEHSLILFDEIGRGTSTFDGMALAQAIIEYITTSIKAKTIFSTHYHELTSLADLLPSIVNLVTKVIEKDGDIEFLYRIGLGKAAQSYGVNVASIAKLPDSVIKRASQLVGELESQRKHVQQSLDIVEIKVIPKPLEQIKDLLSETDINQMTPLQAMQFLADLVEKAKQVK